MSDDDKEQSVELLQVRILDIATDIENLKLAINHLTGINEELITIVKLLKEKT